MQHIKNFKEVKPTDAQLKQLHPLGNALRFLRSEDGQDWYECQSKFSPDTVKIMYDIDGIITAVIDEPVPQRENTYAVSMFFPLDMSVVEIPFSDYPQGVLPDRTWIFDGENIAKRIYTTQEIQQRAEERRKCLMESASETINLWQSELLLGVISDSDKGKLILWMAYIKALKELDFKDITNESGYDAIEWPKKPTMTD